MQKSDTGDYSSSDSLEQIESKACNKNIRCLFDGCHTNPKGRNR